MYTPNTQRPDNATIWSKKPCSGQRALTYDINKLIARSTEPKVWLDHLTNDLMKFWDTDSAKEMTHGLFSTYRANDGKQLKKDADGNYILPPELKAALEADDTKGLVDVNYNYLRAHSRQTYAYGIAFNMTGKEEYLTLCKKGVDGIVSAIDGNFGVFSKQEKSTGKFKPSKQERISQDMAYALIGLAMFYYLTHDETTLYRIIQLKNYIFKAYWDENRGFMTWLPKGQKDGDVEIVAILDQIYAYMHFVVFALPEPYRSEWKNDLRNLVNTLINKFYSERYGFFWGVHSDSAALQLAVDHTDFGHSVKTMWLIYRIGLLVEEPAFVTFARDKIDKILNEAYIERTKTWGRRFNADGEIDNDKEWWIFAELDQAAALLALNDPSYLDYINNTYKYWLDVMTDKEYGEIHHYVHGDTNKPLLKYPKIHCWKTSLHSFEHCLFGYITSSETKGKPFTLYYAFPSDEKLSKERVRPYCFGANIIGWDNLDDIIFRNEGKSDERLRITKVNFDNVR